MAKTDETLDPIQTAISTIDATIVDPPTSGASRETLQKKRAVLEYQSDALRGALYKIEDELHRIETAQWEFKRIDVVPDAVIIFVDLVEKANQYFDFKICAIEKYGLYFEHSNTGVPMMIDTLLNDQQLKLKFNKIGKRQIDNASNAIWTELFGKKHNMLDRKDEALRDWITNLVFEARENGKVLDENPLVELQNIMEYGPHLYDFYFLHTEEAEISTRSSTEEVYDKYAQLRKVVKSFHDARLAVEEPQDVAKADVLYKVKEANKKEWLNNHPPA